MLEKEEKKEQLRAKGYTDRETLKDRHKGILMLIMHIGCGVGIKKMIRGELNSRFEIHSVNETISVVRRRVLHSRGLVTPYTLLCSA